MSEMKTPYEDIKRDCQDLHNFNSEDVKRFVKIGEVREGMSVLDAMCGNGAVSNELTKIKDIKLYLLDNSDFQLNQAKKKIKNARFVVGSVLNMPFEDKTFDRVFIRNGNYEFSKSNQVKLYKEIYRILKEGGSFLNWTLDLDKDNQEFFQKIARKKDSLAGFSDLVKNRYFMTKEELEEDIKNAGFKSVEFFDFKIFYRLSIQKWCQTDFKGDWKKVELWREYIKKLDLKHLGIEIKDVNGDIEIVVPALISIARK